MNAKKRRRFVTLVLSLVFLLGTAAKARATPAAKVDAFHTLLLEVMQTEGFAARDAKLKPAVPAFFDLHSIARISLGGSWRKLADAQRTVFIRLMDRLIVATYASRFDSYSGQRFERVEEVQAGTGPVIKTQLVRSNGERVNLDYYFRGGKVFNVVADGVSDLSLRRADYGSVIRKEGYDALLEHIEDSIAEVIADGGG